MDLIDINRFVSDQLSCWPEAAERHKALDKILTRDIAGTRWHVTFNPGRITSTAAKVDPKSIADRPCFLCDKNRPGSQFALDIGDYQILVNPYPIFRAHLTIPAKSHTPQRIVGRGTDLVSVANALRGYTVFYNGAKCGASAPDHLHYQGVPSDCLPLLEHYPFATIRLSLTRHNATDTLDAALATLHCNDADDEPPVNILAHSVDGDNVEVVIIPRRAHRPVNYGMNDGEILLSPASVDLGGTIVAPRRHEYDIIDSELLDSLFKQLCYERL